MERSEQATVLLLTPFTKYTLFLGAKIKKKKNHREIQRYLYAHNTMLQYILQM